MSRHISRSLLRSSKYTTSLHRSTQTRRLLSTAPPARKSRSWKSSAVRWGLAAGTIYYYNTSPLFADNPTLLEPLIPDSPTDETALPTLDPISKSRSTRSSSLTGLSPTSSTSTLPPITDEPTPSPSSNPPTTGSEFESEQPPPEGAYNEETGEINWDCACLGGMAHGPCGEQFKQAFSCFVYSKEEPKGMDCIEHFKTMQNCFREYPDVYGGELEDEEMEEGEQQADDGAGMRASVVEETKGERSPAAANTAADGEKPAQVRMDDQSEEAKTKRAKEAKAQVERNHAPLSEADELVPKASHDARAPAEQS